MRAMIGAEGLAGTTVLGERLGQLAPLGADERAALARLEERQRSVRRGAAIQRGGDPADELHILVRGLAIGFVELDDGRRQLLRLHVPGDIVGASGLGCRQAIESVSARTDAVVASFDKALLGPLFTRHPRIAGLMLLHVQSDRHALIERLVAIGQLGARARVAGLLLELRDRLGEAGGEIPLPLTQEEIGDMLGLTAVHVNRMLRALADEGAIERRNGGFAIRDEARLRSLLGHYARGERTDTRWLPAH